MITLNIKPSTRRKIKTNGQSIKIRDNKNNYFGSELQIFFSRKTNSTLAMVNYDLPIGAGDTIVSLHILDNDKHTVYQSRSVKYFNENLDEFLLA